MYFSKNLLLSFLLIGIFVVFGIAQGSPKVIRDANELMSRGDFKGAIVLLDKSVEKRKDLLEVYKLRATLRFYNRDLAGAISDLDRAIEIKAEPELFFERANYKTFLRNINGALDDYNSAIAGGYKTEKVYNGRAALKRNTGDLESAIADYRITVGLYPESAQANIGLASTLDQKGDVDAGILLLQNFLDRYEQKRDGSLPKSKLEMTDQNVVIKDEKSDLEPTGESVLLNNKSDGQKLEIGLFGQQMKMNVTANSKEEAEQLMNKQERIINIALAYANLAQMLERKGEFDRALLNVDKSISIFKDDFYPIGLRGRILLDKGDLNGAVEGLTTAINKMPNEATYYDDRGITYLLLGKDAEAQRDFDRFLQLAPRSADYLNKRIIETKQKRSGN